MAPLLEEEADTGPQALAADVPDPLGRRPAAGAGLAADDGPASCSTQSLTDFGRKAAETLERLNRTGEAEIITVNGEARAVLLSPAVYGEMARGVQLSRDAAVIRRSIEQIEAGEGQEVNAFFAEVRAKLLAMQAAQSIGGTNGGTK